MEVIATAEVAFKLGGYMLADRAKTQDEVSFLTLKKSIPGLN